MSSTSSSSTSSVGQAKRARVEAAAPSFLMSRGERDQPLPKVEVVKEDVVGEVLEYVVCGGLKRELFVELMEVMGRTDAVREG